MTKRRNVLIGLSTAVALAGCAEETEDEPEPEADAEQDQEPEEGESEEVEEEIESELEEEEEEENQEDTNREQALEEIEAAEEILDEGLQIYIDQTENGGDTILDVTSMIEDYSFTSVTNHIRDATEHLDNAEEYNVDKLEDQIEQLRTEHEIIDTIARCQRRGQQTRIESDSYLSRMGSGRNVISLERARDSIIENRDEFETCTDNFSVILEDVESTAIVDLDIYAEKNEQFSSELNDFNTYLDIHEDYRRGINTLDDANSAFNNEEYSTAEFRARDAERTFEDVLDILSEADSESLEELTESFESSIESDIRDARSIQEDAAREQDED